MKLTNRKTSHMIVARTEQGNVLYINKITKLHHHHSRPFDRETYEKVAYRGEGIPWCTAPVIAWARAGTRIF